MITKDQLTVFFKYNGDPDGYERLGSSYEKELLQLANWNLIEEIRFDLFLVAHVDVSDSFREAAITKALRNCENLATVKTLQKYVSGQED